MDTRKLLTVVAVLVGCFAGAPARAETEVVGNIPFPVTWTAENSPYLLTGDVKVLNQATLIIEPGVEVRYAADDLLSANEDPDGVELIIEGILIAEGTAEAPILFTGQGDPGPAAHAIGIRLAAASGESHIVYSEFAGLANAIDIQSYTPVTLENITVTEAINGVARTSTVQPFTLLDSDITASGHALDMSVPDAGVDVTFEGITIDGDVRIEGDLLAGSNLTIAASTFAGRFWLKGTAGADSAISISDSEFNGTLFIGNDVGLYLGSSPKSWDESVSTCTDQGLVLAEIENDEELSELQIIALNTGAPLWIGATKNTNYKCDDTYQAHCWHDYQFENCEAWQSQGYACKSFSVTSCNPNGKSGNGCKVAFFSSPYMYDANSWNCVVNSCAYSTCAPSDIGNWYWNSGTSWNFTNWASNQSLKCQDDRAVALLLDSTWLASVKTTLRPFLCIHESAINDPSALATLSISNATVAGSLSVVAGPTQVSGLSASGIQYFNTMENITFTDSQISGSLRIDAVGNTVFTRSDLTGHFRANAAKTDVTYSWFNGEAVGDRIHITGPLSFNTNIVSNAGAVGLQLETGGSAVPSVIAYNTFVDNPSGIVVDGDTGAGGVSVSNNIVIRGAGSGVKATNGSVVTVSHNDVWEYATAYDGMAADVNASSYNPLFIQDLPSDQPNFALQSFSPLIDIGTCEEAFETDFAGMPRPFDGDFDAIAKCDVGAYEFGPETTYVTGDKPFGTGQETNLILMGVSGGFEYPLAGAAFTVTPEAGIYEPGSQRYRPTHLPGMYEGAITAVFGGLETVLDLDLPCGCKTPDYPDGTPGECNGVPDCYYGDWDCEVRDVYCELYDSGVLPAPVSAYIKQQMQLRGGGRDAFGFVFGVEGLIDYDVVAGGGAVSEAGEFVAGVTAATFPDSLKTDWNGFVGYTDIVVGSGVPTAIVITAPSSAIPTTQQGQYSAVVYDDEGNVVEGADVQWHIEAGVDAEVDLLTGVVTAGCTPGTYPGAVVANHGLVEQAEDLVVVGGGAVPDSIVIEPVAATVPAMTSTTFIATVFDGCGAQITNGIIFSADGAVGVIDAETGEFTAGCNQGEHAQAVAAIYGDLSTSANVTITAGALGSLELTPSQAQVDTTSNTPFTVSGHDVCGNSVAVDPEWYTGIPYATLIEDQPGTGELTLTCAPIGTYENGVLVSQGDVTVQASVEVLAGAAETIAVEPTVLTLEVGSYAQLDATLLDACGNPIPGVVSFSAASGGTVDENGLVTAGTVAGTWQDAVTVSSGDQSAKVTLIVTPGAAVSLVLSPDPIVATAAGTVQVAVGAEDAYGNEFVPDTVDWSADEQAGNIDEDGVFTAGTVVGDYVNGVSATVDGVSADVDVLVEPGEASDIVVTSASPIILTPNATAQLSAVVQDEYGNEVDTSVTWSVVGGGGTVNEAGLFTAGLVAGTFEDTVRAATEDLEVFVDVTVTPGPPTELENVIPQSATLQPNGQQLFVTMVMDAWGNDTGLSPQWSVVAGGGSIVSSGNDAGQFTAGEDVGTFPQTVRAKYGTTSVFADVTVVEGEVAQVIVTPSLVSMAVNQSVEFTAQAFDAYDNPLDMNATWSLAPGTNASINQLGVLTLGCGVEPGYHPELVKASVLGIVGSADVEVTAGDTVYISMGAPFEEVPVMGQAMLTATAQDACGNATGSLLTWLLPEGGGSISPTGIFTAGTVAGTYPVKATANGVEGQILVAVLPGEVDSIALSPQEATVTVGGTASFEVEAADQFGNAWQPEDVVWEAIPEAGEIDENGGFTAGIVTGDYLNAVVASLDGKIDKADVFIIPGEAEVVEIAPLDPTVFVGQELQFSATVLDAFGNALTDADCAFECSADVGECTEGGLLTACLVPGEYEDAVTASCGALSVSTEVIVVAGAPSVIEITPSSTTSAIGTTVEFSVKVLDNLDVLIQDAVVTWSADPDLGEVNVDGVLEIGTTPGEYPDGVVASIGDVEGYADVTVPVDFDEDGMADVDELAYGFDPLDDSDVLADTDEDGLSSIEEYIAGIDPTDADSDDDGLLDGQEPKWSEDTDGDGLINAADPDADDDGILDGTEAGVTEASADTDESSGNFTPDADPATTTDSLKADTDDDGISDGTEDINHNGALDPGETDPNDAANLTACGTVDDCPEGEYCAESGFCYVMEAEPTPDSGVLPDAGPDLTEVTSEDVVTVPGPSHGASGCAATPANNADPQAAFLIFLAMLTLVFIIQRRSRHRR